MWAHFEATRTSEEKVVEVSCAVFPSRKSRNTLGHHWMPRGHNRESSSLWFGAARPKLSTRERSTFLALLTMPNRNGTLTTQLSCVQKCLKQISQGVNLWCLRERKMAGRESSRKSFPKECQKTCAAKVNNNNSSNNNSNNNNNNKNAPAKAKTVVVKAPRKPCESNSIG